MAGTEEKKIDSNVEEMNDNVTELQVEFEKCQPGSSCEICYPSKTVSTSGHGQERETENLIEGIKEDSTEQVIKNARKEEEGSVDTALDQSKSASKQNTTMTGIGEKEIESNIEEMNDKVTSSQENNEFDQILPLNSSSTSQPKIVSTSGHGQERETENLIEGIKEDSTEQVIKNASKEEEGSVDTALDQSKSASKQNTTMTGIEEKEIESNIEELNDKVTSSLENNEFDQIWPLNSSSTSQPKIVSTSETTTIKINCDQTEDTYFFGEDANIFAYVGTPSAVLRVAWMKEKGSECKTINLKLQKYTGSTCTDSNEVENLMLTIKNCDKADVGTYFLMVACRDDLYIYSNKINLQVVEGCPEVTLNPVPMALVNGPVEFKATIRGFPKYHPDSVTWMKDNQLISITDPKYERNINNSGCPVLKIKKVTEGDKGVYTIIVHNDFGKGKSCSDLEVVGASEMIFISGPVAVYPLETIMFLTCLPGREISNVKWWKIKDQSTEELKVNNLKYCIYQMEDKIRFEITYADKDDCAAYQLSFGNKRSNRIYVQVDGTGKFSTSQQGNCLRLFELQTVSADALRILFNKVDGTLKDKIERYCRSSPHSSWKKELLSRLQDEDIDKSKYVDITLMYWVIKESMKKENITKPHNGWGKLPEKSNTNKADDIERIHHYRNIICHRNASGIDTNEFNKSCLDLFGAIGRLSLDDPELIQTSCCIMNRVCTKGKYLQDMIEKIKILDKEKELNQHPINEDPSSCPLAFSKEDIGEGPNPRTSTNKVRSSIPSLSSKENSDESHRPRSTTPFSSIKVRSSILSLSSKEVSDKSHRPRSTTPFSSIEVRSSIPSLSSKEDCDKSHRPRSTTPFSTIKDLSFSLLTSSKEDGNEVQAPITSHSSTNKESLHNIRISTRDSGMGQIRFHEVCDQGIILYDNFMRAKQSRHNKDGICFMNRPMKLDEKVHIYGLTSSHCNAPFKGIRAKIRIGLTNTDPEQYRKPVYEMKYCSKEIKEFDCFSKDDKASDFFHICICLCPDATLSICINEAQKYFYKYEEISPDYPIWLVIEPFEISPIRISEI